MDRNCGTCRYALHSGIESRCHRFPPSPFPMFETSPIGGKPRHAGDLTTFPRVNKNMWCGEHNPLPPEDTTD